MAIFAEENGWLNEDSEVPYMEVLRTKGNWIICKILGGDPGYVLTNKETGHRVSFDSITEAKDYVEAFEKPERFVTLGKLGDPVPPLKENAKAIVAEGKPKTESVPPIAVLALGAAMQNGSDKYGKFNWRDTEVKASTFYNAMMRHLITWYNGEDYADDSGIHHLAHLMASCAIILDAENNHVFVDDRNPGRMINLNVYLDPNKDKL